MKKLLSLFLSAVLFVGLLSVGTLAAEETSGDKPYTGWLRYGGGLYYCDETGRPVSGWHEIDGTRYYFDSRNCRIVYSAWRQIDGYWYYFRSNAEVFTGWSLSGGRLYYFEKNAGEDMGKLAAGWWNTDAGRYYFDPQFHYIVYNELRFIDGNYYYFRSDATVYTGWLEYNGARYYYDCDGTLVSGWVTIDDERYYFDPVTYQLADFPYEPIDPGELIVVYKPVIYLYPEDKTDVTVTLGNPAALTAVYPEYGGGWQMTALPDGTLTDASGREYYSLYYEADVQLPIEDEDGFLVQGEDIVPFLEEKLALLGLSDREAEEMIIYWLPQMQAYPYVFIRFADAETIEEAMPLEVNPAPDSVLRVWMQWRGLEEPLDAEPQELSPSVRAGFTVVEWGGFEVR